MKDSFILYTRYARQIESLSMEQRGVLFTAILCHENNASAPEMDAVTAMAFSFIEADLNDNAEKYAQKCAKNAANGARGGRPVKAEETEKANGYKKSERFSKKQTVIKKTDNDNDSDNENDIKEKPSKKKFAPPSVDLVREYCRERNNSVDPERFVDFYTAKGWKVGDQPMKDWKACVRTWERNKSGALRGKPPDRQTAGRFANFPQRTDDASRELIAKVLAMK